MSLSCHYCGLGECYCISELQKEKEFALEWEIREHQRLLEIKMAKLKKMQKKHRTFEVTCSGCNGYGSVKTFFSPVIGWCYDTCPTCHGNKKIDRVIWSEDLQTRI